MKNEQKRVTHFGERRAVSPASGRRAGGLYVQVIVVYERPRPLHVTGLKLVVEGSDVRVAKHATVQVLWRPTFSREESLLVDAGVPRQRRLGQGAGPGGGSLPRTAMLDEEVLDALDSRVVG